jgi:kynurenine formamidase
MPQIVDLSQELFQGQPVYPGHPPTLSFPVTRVQRLPDGRWTFAVGGLLMSEHGGTHTDGFCHMDDSPDAASIDRLPLNLFITPGTCVDVQTVEPGETITPAHLEAAGCVVPAGGTVLVHTGHYARTFPKPAYLQRYAGLGRAAMEWLADRGAVNVGIDAPSVDPAPDPAGEWKPAHAVCRERGVLNSENLGDLSPVAGRNFLYVGLPLKVRGGTAGPTRAVALLFEDGGWPEWATRLQLQA